MTTDNFTQAARAEAEALVDDIICWDDSIATDGPCDGTWDSLAAHLTERGWARTHLAAQEPTDAEVLAVARLFYRTQCGHDLLDGSVYKDRWMNTARAALSAARAARRDEEERDE